MLIAKYLVIQIFRYKLIKLVKLFFTHVETGVALKSSGLHEDKDDANQFTERLEKGLCCTFACALSGLICDGAQKLNHLRYLENYF